MKICMVGYTKFEGDGRLHRYAMSLLERGHTVHMVGLGEPIQAEPVTIYGVQVFRIHSRDFQEKGPATYLNHMMTFFWRSFITLTRLHMKHRYHVIHFHNIPDFGIFCTLFAKLFGARVILDIHDLVPEFYMRKFNVSESHVSIRLIKWIEKLSCRYADHVITVTEIWRQRLIQRSVPGRHCSVVMNLPIESLFHKLPLNEHKPGDPFHVVYHGNLAEQTGVDLLIQAVDRLKDKIPQLQLTIVGGGREMDDYRTLADSLGISHRVRFHGSVVVPDIVDAVCHAHVAVDPKRKGVYAGETLSVKAMEYLALGIPLIVARTMAASFYFYEDTVRFFKPNNVDSLADAVFDLYQHPEKRRHLHIHADDFNRRYNWKQARQTYLSVLSDITGREV